MGFQSRTVFILALIWLLLQSPVTAAGKGSFYPRTVHPASSPDSLYISKRYDRFIAPDKAKHFTASLISTVFFYKIFEGGLNLDEREGKIYSLSITIGLGLSKEFYDRSRPNNYFSWKDLLADIAGITAGFILINQP